MVAQSQYCMSGDNTLESMQLAIKQATSSNDDDDASDGGNFVFLFSDANLERYGISPRQLGNVMQRGGDSVQAYAFFIGSLANQAERLSSALPSGRGHVCLETSVLPSLFKRILQDEALR